MDDGRSMLFLLCYIHVKWHNGYEARDDEAGKYGISPKRNAFPLNYESHVTRRAKK